MLTSQNPPPPAQSAGEGCDFVPPAPRAGERIYRISHQQIKPVKVTFFTCFASEGSCCIKAEFQTKPPPPPHKFIAGGGMRSDITHVFARYVYLYNVIWTRNSISRAKSTILPEGYIRLYCIKRLFKY